MSTVTWAVSVKLILNVVCWLNGFGVTGTTGGIPAVLGAYVSPVGPTWLAYVNATSISAGPTDTTVRIYYTYTA